MKFKTIVIDPPWQLENQATEAAPEYAECFRYETLPLKEIADMRICALADTNCHLYLWTVDALKHEAYDLVERWGFVAKCELVWVKMTKWGKPVFGMGNYYRHQHESCIFAVRGSMRLMRKDLPTVIIGESVRHSQKPSEFYKRVLVASPPPRLELFARKNRDGFYVWGDDPNIKSADVEVWKC